MDRAPVLPSVNTRTDRFEDKRSADIPDDAVLEASGARIGHVFFRNLELFDIGGRDQDSSLFRLGNRLSTCGTPWIQGNLIKST